MADGPLRILLACPAYWPARAFGGPVVVARELVRRLCDRGHTVDILTTTLQDLHTRPSSQTSIANVDRARVHYLGTPLHYRWMGITPTLPWWLARLAEPDVAHVYGFRDPVTTATAAWCRPTRYPYFFGPLGMLRPRLRKVGLKHVLDNTLYRGVASGATRLVAGSALEAEDAVAAGIERSRIVVRGNGFPNPDAMPVASGRLRRELNISDDAAVVLYVGRIASGKGIEHVLDAARRLIDVHVVLVGPDDRHGAIRLVRAAQSAEETAGRVHVLPPDPEPPLWLYPEADVLVLASTGESFGMVAAEAAAAGTPVVITDRVGVKDFFRDGEAMIVPDRRDAVVDAIQAVIDDQALRMALATGGRAAAHRMSWDHVTDLQEAIYRAAAFRIASTKLSREGS